MNVRERGTVADADGSAESFRTVFVLYLVVSVACLVVAIGVLFTPVLEVPRMATLGVVPTVVTVATAGGLAICGWTEDLPERMGRSRRRLAAVFLPTLSIVIVVLVATTAFEVTGRMTRAAVTLAAVTIVPTVGVVTMARTSYVATVVDDEPAATCSWVDTGWTTGPRRLVLSSTLAATLLAPIAGWTSLVAGGFFLAFALALFFLEATRRTFSRGLGDPVSELRVHDAGVVLENAGTERFVPWESILEVRLTEDELVFERHLLDLCGDRSVIDDPDAIWEASERVRGDSPISDGEK